MNFEFEIKKIIDENIKKNVFPDISVGIIFNEKNARARKIISSDNIQQKNLKGKSIYFDIASLTKPLVTVISLLSLIKYNKISLSTTLDEIFNDNYIPYEKKYIDIEKLLSHSAGFAGHRDYYKELIKVSPEKRKELLLKFLLNEPLLYKPGCKALYSDLGYMLLGLIIENIAGLNLDVYFRQMILEPVGLAEHLFFNPMGANRHRAEEFAAVENCPWRGRVLRGEVSDENCWALGGVAGHAGLYGDIGGVLALTELLMDIWLAKRSHPHVNRRDLVNFLTRRTEVKGGTWALGFDTPTPGKSSSGKYLSTKSVGHLGFTGTSFWIDPERELIIVILSNRVHPSRDNQLIREFRPVFHDRVVELLGL
jgi:CubicO group peptidase (beta-lactamase class C family)